MTWGLVAVAGATLVGGVVQSNSASNAADAQVDAANAGIASEERMFNQSLELQQPYREAGYESLSGLQNLTTADGRAQSLNDYYGSDEYLALQNQQEEQVMRNSQMTGGVRSGSNQQALASIAPQLGQNYLSSQYNNLTGIANMGMGAASQGASAANNLGSSMNTTYNNIGQAQASNSIAQGSIASDTIGTLGGLASDYFKRI